MRTRFRFAHSAFSVGWLTWALTNGFPAQFVSYASPNGHAFVVVSAVPGCEDSSWRRTDHAVTYEAMIEVHAASYAPNARSSVGAELSL